MSRADLYVVVCICDQTFAAELSRRSFKRNHRDESVSSSSSLCGECRARFSPPRREGRQETRRTLRQSWSTTRSAGRVSGVFLFLRREAEWFARVVLEPLRARFVCYWPPLQGAYSL